ncbi:hypothetical protein [Nocardiopsis sp. JB363]|uniref:hypothetical protein n=1 Tax=Nocardiopsis sp. JB363 TaxID=1434837 RepID=UPI000B358ED2|nr:hypothetical protein [Nocardiopsis sp. JB363]
MPIPHPHEPLGLSERERPSATKLSGPPPTPQDLVPHLRDLARALREQGAEHGPAPHTRRV